jgi:phosphate/sulfate permease
LKSYAKWFAVDKICVRPFVAYTNGALATLFGSDTMMAAGAVVHARRVAETLSHRITRMNHAQDFSANLVTVRLVAVAPRFGFPVRPRTSRAVRSSASAPSPDRPQQSTIGGVLLAWLVTLPTAAILAVISRRRSGRV